MFDNPNKWPAITESGKALELANAFPWHPDSKPWGDEIRRFSEGDPIVKDVFCKSLFKKISASLGNWSGGGVWSDIEVSAMHTLHDVIEQLPDQDQYLQQARHTLQEATSKRNVSLPKEIMEKFGMNDKN